MTCCPGAAAADVFVFYHNDGHDTVLDFDPEEDRIELHLFGDRFDWRDLYIRSDGRDSVIRLDESNSLTLSGVAKSRLGEKNFIFVAEERPFQPGSDEPGYGGVRPGTPVNELRIGTAGDDTITTGVGNDTLDGGPRR